MARQAERERRAKVIAAQGELQASATLAQAARTLAIEPSALQLRYLHTVTEIAPGAAGAATAPPPQIKVEGSSALPHQIRKVLTPGVR